MTSTNDLPMPVVDEALAEELAKQADGYYMMSPDIPVIIRSYSRALTKLRETEELYDDLAIRHAKRGGELNQALAEIERLKGIGKKNVLETANPERTHEPISDIELRGVSAYLMEYLLKDEDNPSLNIFTRMRMRILNDGKEIARLQARVKELEEQRHYPKGLEP